MKEKFDAVVEHLLKSSIFLPQAIEILERSMIQRALESNGGKQSAAAKMLGIHRNTLQRKMNDFGLSHGRVRVRRKPATGAGRVRKRGSKTA